TIQPSLHPGLYSSSLALSKASGMSLVLATIWGGILGPRGGGRGPGPPGCAGGAGTGDHALQVHPATPEGKPAGLAVALAVLVAAQAGQGQEELPHRQGPHLLVAPAREDLDELLVDDRAGRQVAQPGIAAEVAQAEQPYRHHAEQGDHRLQPRHICELRIFDAA